MGFKKETVEEVLKYPIREWPEAGIRYETMKRFGCRVALSEKDGKTIEAVYFPSYNKDGSKIIGFQKKDLTIPKEDNYHFTNVGVVRVVNQMYGQKQAQHGGKNLWITEGWKDLMSAYQALKDDVAGTQWENMHPAVVSVVGGTANAAKSVAHNESFVRSFNQQIICMDNDERTKLEPLSVVRGKEAKEEIGSYLSSDSVFVPNYPDDINDLNDMLLKKGSKALVNLIRWDIKPYQAEKIVTFNDVMTFEEAVAPIKPGIMLKGFPKYNELLRGTRMHELTTITGLPGSGKSSFAFEEVYQFAEQGHKVGLIMLEDPIIETQHRIAARYCHVNLCDYDENPLKAVGGDKNKLREAWEYSINPDRFMVLHHFGSIASKSLISKVKSLTASGCQILLIDHASMSVSGLETTDERKDLDILYTALSAFVAAHPVHIKIVCHVDKKAGTQDNKRPSEPKWQYINPNNLRGTAGIFQLSCNVIVLHSELLPDGSRGRVMIGVAKNRRARKLGDADIVRMDDKTGLWYDASGEVWTPKDGGY